MVCSPWPGRRVVNTEQAAPYCTARHDTLISASSLRRDSPMSTAQHKHPARLPAKTIVQFIGIFQALTRPRSTAMGTITAISLVSNSSHLLTHTGCQELLTRRIDHDLPSAVGRSGIVVRLTKPTGKTIAPRRSMTAG